MQEFGNEVFGKSAQQKGQSSTGTASGTGSGDVVKEAAEMGPLLDCTVSFLMDLPEKKKKLQNDKQVNEATGSWDKFITAINNLQKHIQEKCNDEEWKKSHN